MIAPETLAAALRVAQDAAHRSMLAQRQVQPVAEQQPDASAGVEPAPRPALTPPMAPPAPHTAVAPV